MEIGAQFYTVRDHCKTLSDFSESLKKVADIGYKTVQISGVCPYEPAWLAEELKKNDLRCVITHTPLERMEQDPAAVAADHDMFGCRCVGLGWYGMQDEQLQQDYDSAVSLFRRVGQAMKDHGKYFMYHNHDGEFRHLGGKPILQKLSEDLPADLLGFTLDTYWVQSGGGDPAWWLENLTGRVPCIHLKDFGYGRKMCVVGEGNLNFDRIFEKAEAAGTQYMLVEQDDCNGEDPFACLKRSYDYLHACGF